MEENIMTVADLMTTALITMKPTDAVDSAGMEMKYASIRHIPIVDDRNRLVGMLSHRDILRALGKAQKGTIVVGEIMTKRVHTISADAPVYEASALILAHKIGALPVLGDDQQLVGLITETDFVRYAHEMLGGEIID
jgi:CBS domain-containing protein